MTNKLKSSLLGLQAMTPAQASADTAVAAGIRLQAATLAGMLSTERQIVHSDAAEQTFDPRFLVFEFTYSMVLRQQQYELILRFSTDK